MAMTLRRYGGGAKQVRESRYLGGFGAFARAFGIREGTCVDFEQRPDHPGRLWAAVTPPALSQQAADQQEVAPALFAALFAGMDQGTSSQALQAGPDGVPGEGC